MKRLIALLLVFLLPVLFLTGCGRTAGTGAEMPTEAFTLITAAPDPKQAEGSAKQAEPVTEPQAVADFLFLHGELPGNFITKQEAQELGWDSGRNYVSDVAPGKSLGGDLFGNYEGQLPKAKGRKFFECDVNYRGGKRGEERIVYSNDGHVWYTGDHFESFEELFPSE